MILNIFFFLLITSFYEAKYIFMSIEGNDDTGDGTIENPYHSIMKCQNIASTGDTVYIRGGTYSNFDIAYSTNTYNYVFYFTKSYITYKAYESEKVIFDFEYDKKYGVINGVLKQRITGFMINEGAENITFENFDCTRIPTLSFDEIVAAKLSKNLTQSECFQSRGKNIRFNRINAYSNYGIGFYFLGTKSYNIAYRCDAYNNTGIDSASLGNADGFGSHGTGSEFIECRAWDNSDDNYDCINSYAATIFDKSWAFRINFKNSDVQDGNGFKVGGWGKSATAKNLYGPFSGENPPVHIVKNCIAAYNKANGFYTNHQPGQCAVWYNNRAYNNKANFDMTEGSETWELDSKGKVVDICGTREVLYFNFGHKYSTKLSTTTCNMYGTEGNLFSANIPDKNNKFNSWNFRNITLSDNDFLSLDINELAGERGEDGSLPEVNFMKLNPNGPNYELLKTIEEEMKNYEIKSDGTIVKINQNEEEEEEEEHRDKKEDTKEKEKIKEKEDNIENLDKKEKEINTERDDKKGKEINSEKDDKKESESKVEENDNKDIKETTKEKESQKTESIDNSQKSEDNESETNKNNENNNQNHQNSQNTNNIEKKSDLENIVNIKTNIIIEVGKISLEAKNIGTDTYPKYELTATISEINADYSEQKIEYIFYRMVEGTDSDYIEIARSSLPTYIDEPFADSENKEIKKYKVNYKVIGIYPDGTTVDSKIDGENQFEGSYSEEEKNDSFPAYAIALIVIFGVGLIGGASFLVYKLLTKKAVENITRVVSDNVENVEDVKKFEG